MVVGQSVEEYEVESSRFDPVHVLSEADNRFGLCRPEKALDSLRLEVERRATTEVDGAALCPAVDPVIKVLERDVSSAGGDFAFLPMEGEVADPVVAVAFLGPFIQPLVDVVLKFIGSADPPVDEFETFGFKEVVQGLEGWPHRRLVLEVLFPVPLEGEHSGVLRFSHLYLSSTRNIRQQRYAKARVNGNQTPTCASDRSPEGG